jgi:hypothetical protein
MAAAILSIDSVRFNNLDYIEERVSSAARTDRGSLRTALTYLYADDGPINLPRPRLTAALPYLEEAERILIRWLYTRTNGSERKSYGAGTLIAARRSRYSCEQEDCRFADVRALTFDHVNGRTSDTCFACLCANCHMIKSRAKDWTGRKVAEVSV